MAEDHTHVKRLSIFKTNVYIFMRKPIMLFLPILMTFSCRNAQHERELSSREKELALKEQELTNKSETNQATSGNQSAQESINAAEKQFEKYLPNILKTHDAVLDLQESHAGDFTGDGKEDVLIYFSLGSKYGGNAMVGQGITLYENLGDRVRVIAGYEPDYLFVFNRISHGKIYVDKLEYDEDDGRCCPSIKTEHMLTISGNRAY